MKGEAPVKLETSVAESIPVFKEIQQHPGKILVIIKSIPPLVN
jgi:hypothetical protein